MEPELLQAVQNNIAAHEDRKLSMYLDTEGVVTCGVGHALFCVGDAYKVLWWASTSELATRLEVERAYTAIKRKATQFVPSLLMTYEETNRILTLDLEIAEHTLRREFSEFDSFPFGPRTALFDMVFNLGSLEKWPHLSAAVQAKDWKTAAAECTRKGIGEQRNSDTREQFLAA